MIHASELNADLVFTCAALALCIAVFAYGRAVAARPAEIGRVRMIPWNGVLVALGLAIIVLLVHLANLMGIQTGATRP